MYLVAILLPPLAVFMCGKPIQGLVNILLTFMFWVPGAVHAIMVVSARNADKRTDRLIEATKAAAAANIAANTEARQRA